MCAKQTGDTERGLQPSQWPVLSDLATVEKLLSKEPKLGVSPFSFSLGQQSPSLLFYYLLSRDHSSRLAAHLLELWRIHLFCTCYTAAMATKAPGTISWPDIRTERPSSVVRVDVSLRLCCWWSTGITCQKGKLATGLLIFYIDWTLGMISATWESDTQGNDIWSSLRLLPFLEKVTWSCIKEMQPPT